MWVVWSKWHRSLWFVKILTVYIGLLFRAPTALKPQMIAAIWPSSSAKHILRGMLLSGTNIAWLNFSYGSHEQHKTVIVMIRSLSRERKRTAAIILDLQGPKIGSGTLKGRKPVLRRKNGKIRITLKKVSGTGDVIVITHTDRAKDAKWEGRIPLDYGLTKSNDLFKTKQKDY